MINIIFTTDKLHASAASICYGISVLMDCMLLHLAFVAFAGHKFLLELEIFSKNLVIVISYCSISCRLFCKLQINENHIMTELHILLHVVASAVLMIFVA